MKRKKIMSAALIAALSFQSVPAMADTFYERYAKLWGTQGDEVTVSVVDTGLSADALSAYADRISQKNISSYFSDGDTDGHGTKVASVILQNTPNNVSVFMVKAGESGDSISGLNAYTAVYQAYKYGDVINMSLSTDSTSVSFESYFRWAYSDNIPIIAGAGNDYGDDAANYYPAKSIYSWSVGAVDYSGNLASFSNIGADFYAFGKNVNVINLNGETVLGNGTSFASPLVAAYAALLKSYGVTDIDDIYDCLSDFCYENDEGYNVVVWPRDVADIAFSISGDSFVYTGSAIKPSITGAYIDGNPVSDELYSVTYEDNVEVGTGYIIINGQTPYVGETQIEFEITGSEDASDNDSTNSSSTAGSSASRSIQTITAQNVTQTYKAKNLAKANKSFKISASTSGDGEITYSKISGNSKISVGSKGKVTVKKGLTSGTYKVNVKVKAAKTAKYKKATKTIKITVKVTGNAVK